MGRDLTFDLRSDLAQAVDRLEARTAGHVDAAAATALNRTSVTVRAEAVRKIGGTYNIKASVIRDQLRLKRADRSRLEAQVIASGRRIPLIAFQARQTRRGVTVRVKQERKLVRGVFIAKMPTGHTGVFERKGRARLPIRELFSVSLPQAFTNRQILAALKQIAKERFGIEFARAMKFRQGR